MDICLTRAVRSGRAIQQVHLWLHVDADGRDIGPDRVDVDALREDSDAEGRDGDGAWGDAETGGTQGDGRDCTQATSILKGRAYTHRKRAIQAGSCAGQAQGGVTG